VSSGGKQQLREFWRVQPGIVGPLKISKIDVAQTVPAQEGAIKGLDMDFDAFNFVAQDLSVKGATALSFFNLDHGKTTQVKMNSQDTGAGAFVAGYFADVHKPGGIVIPTLVAATNAHDDMGWQLKLHRVTTKKLGIGHRSGFSYVYLVFFVNVGILVYVYACSYVPYNSHTHTHTHTYCSI
jgi:hypothetical protein